MPLNKETLNMWLYELVIHIISDMIHVICDRTLCLYIISN